MIELLLVDDHEVVRRGLRDLFEREDDITVVAEAGSVAGASGYVLKEVRSTELVSSVRLVAAGGSLLDPELVRQVRSRLRRRAAEEERVDRLSPQERRILDLIADGKTNRQIAQEMFLAEKTVKNYVSNLLAKLGFSRRTEAAVFVARLENERDR